MGDVDADDPTHPDRVQRSRTTDPWAIIDAIKDVHRGVDITGGLLPSLVLPGFGTKRITCGDYRPHFCGDCGGPTPGTDVCNKSTCPHCAPNWARIRATAVCRKLAALRAMLDATHHENQRFHHLTISPPEDFRFESDDALQRGFEAVRDFMAAFGLQGFAVYHPYRGANGDDRGFWKDILFNAQDWDAVQGELTYAPHFHVIGVTDFVQGEGVTDVVNHETGWVIKRITEGGDESASNVSIGDNLDLARAVTYTLSHVGIYQTTTGRNRYAARWYGPDAHDVTPPEQYKREWERIVRTVSTKTLGLNKKDLLCDRDDVASTQVNIGTYHAAMAEMSNDKSASSGPSPAIELPEHTNVDATGEVTIGSSGPVADDGTDVPTLPDTAVEQEGGEGPCDGPLYDISRAPDFLKDDEWVDQAPYARQLEDAYEHWQIGNAFLTQTRRDLEAIREGRFDDVAIDLEKPPPA